MKRNRDGSDVRGMGSQRNRNMRRLRSPGRYIFNKHNSVRSDEELYPNRSYSSKDRLANIISYSIVYLFFIVVIVLVVLSLPK